MGLASVPFQPDFLMVSDHPRRECCIPGVLFYELSTPVLRAQEPHSPPWNVVRVRDGEGVRDPGMIQEGPTKGAHVNLASEEPPKNLDPLVGLPQSAWDYINLLVRNASGGSAIHTNNARVRVKWSWTQSQVCLIQFSLSCVENNGESFDIYLLNCGWWCRSYDFPEDLNSVTNVSQIARLHLSLCLASWVKARAAARALAVLLDVGRI